MTRPEFTFTNARGATITTHDPATALKYRADAGFTEVVAPPVPYARRRKADLQTEIAARNVGRGEDTQLPTTGTAAELAAALDADDAAQTDSTGAGGDAGTA